MAKLTIDTDVPLTAREKAILRILLDEAEPAAAPAAEPAKAEEKKPARKAPAKKAPAKSQKTEKPAEEVADKEPETDNDDELTAQAIKVARALVRDGDAATVQKGLEAADAARVSEMTGEQAAKFLEAVQ